MKFSKKQNILIIGDLVTLSSNFKKSRYKAGSAPIYQWMIGGLGYIRIGELCNNQTAIILKSKDCAEYNADKKMFKLIIDSGLSGWFCEGADWLIKN
tara:strand:+ start:1338 stop:1628 length:291 start_codon:yes stop_codon:yes gene_type:complete